MNHEYHPRDKEEVLRSDRERIEEKDIFDYWGAELVRVGWEEEYIREEMERYRSTAQKIVDNPDIWPAGEADFKRTFLKLVIKPCLMGPHNE